MRRFVLALLTAAMVASPAVAGQKEQEASVKNLAMLMYGEARCPNLRPNYMLMMKGMAILGVAPRDWADGGKYHGVLVAELLRMKSSMDGTSEDIVCTIMEDGFGPDGTIASGFIKRR